MSKRLPRGTGCRVSQTARSTRKRGKPGTRVCLPGFPPLSQCEAAWRSRRRSPPAAMAALAPAAEDLAQGMICPICHELFRSPVILECGHDFCQECIDRYWGGEGVCSCPMCKREHPDRKYIPNRSLGQMAGALRDKEEADAARRQVLFCAEDETLVPAQCVSSPEHCHHRLLSLQEAAGLYREKMTSALSTLKSSLQGLKTAEERQAEKAKDIKMQYLSLEDRISQEFAALHQWLQEREQGLMKELKREEERLLGVLDASCQHLAEKIRATEKDAEQIRSWLEKPDPADLLKDVKSFITKLCLEENREPNPDAGQAQGDLCLGHFKGPTQYAVWKEMKNIIHPVPSPVTFDPKTANPLLILSKDLTSMSVAHPKEEVQDHPLRFSKSTCVLGSVGMSSGRHYWEVAVGNKGSWDIGVAKVSIDRKTIIMLKPKNGYWAIWLRNGHEYKALDTPSRSLTLRVQPQRIGVYLDYEAGQVSFYNAEDMSHIYTFKDTFTEILYPMFGPGVVNNGENKEPVRIIHLRL